MSRWIEVRRGRIPSGPGVYVVYQQGTVVYVGSSTNVAKRVRTYFRKERREPSFDDPPTTRPPFCTPWGFYHNGTGIRVKVKLSRRLGEWLMWEWRLIRRLRPRYNSAGVNNAG